ncbi:hypothetical protein [Paraburkholderia terricola]|uniref:Secreted protein n=1 Tax=Paraburkholderia terricola TaxID=169427 RepID=A0ABU1LU68_9BURK|nr:hypothetical protein [Paraburkholderia terricola]MDR6410282.1 hypothetical protein [Paraburkholderia terricola]MDR6481442.1 hypothetical protein [Paraburkholderia terricola]
MLLLRSLNLTAGVACALLLASANVFSQPCSTADDCASLLHVSTHDDNVRAERHREEQLREERLRSERLRSERLRSDRLREERLRSDRLRADRLREERLRED